MGCDIHIVLEFRDIDTRKWIGEFSSDNYKAVGCHLVISNRDYSFFAEVAHVRGEPTATGNFPKNLPKDVSDLAWSKYMRAPTDFHSPSHMTPQEFCEAWMRSNTRRGPEIRDDYPVYDLLGIDPDDEREYRVVFWFDN